MTKSLAALSLAACLVAGCAKQTIQPDRLPPVPPVQNVAVNAELVDRAMALVRRDLVSNDPIRRANAVEATESLPRDVATPLLVEAMKDADARVRFATAMTIGRRRIDSPVLREGLQSLLVGESDNARVAALFALHRLGDTSLSQQLVAASRDDDPFVRANAAVALGLTGEPSALPVVEPMLRDPDSNVRLNAAEAAWRLGDEKGLRMLLAGSLSQYPDERTIATLALSARRGNLSMSTLQSKLTDMDPEVALAAARGLGKFGRDTGYGVAMRELRDAAPGPRDGDFLQEPADETGMSEGYIAARGRSVRRLMAAMAFGDIGRADAQRLLAPLFKDPDPDVRLAAASAVLRLQEQADLDAVPAASVQRQSATRSFRLSFTALCPPPVSLASTPARG